MLSKKQRKQIRKMMYTNLKRAGIGTCGVWLQTPVLEQYRKRVRK